MEDKDTSHQNKKHKNHHPHKENDKHAEHSGNHNHHHGDKANGHHDHTAHHKMMVKDFKKRFWISLVLTVPVLLLSKMFQSLLGFEFSMPGGQYILVVFASVIYFWGGWPFLKGMYNELKQKNPGMMTLIALAVSVSYFYSVATVFGLKGHDFFWELATLIDIMLVGHWIEMKSVLGASKSLELLAQMMPSGAHRLRNGEVEDVKLEDLNKDDLVLIKPGEKVPADATITEGNSFMDESMLTGESKPVKHGKGDHIIGGSINGNQSLKAKVEHTGEDSYLNKVISMVREAQQSKSKMQSLSDKAAMWLTFIALGAGFLTFAYWYFFTPASATSPFLFALTRMVTVMVITCPHALGLAIPLVVAISTSVSAQNGLLIRNRTAFENSRKISAIIFDKTGTLTKGEFGVSKFKSFDNKSDDEKLLRFAAALEQDSEHPIGAGIIKKAKELKIDLPEIKDFNAITGKGVEAKVDGKEVKVVSPGYLKENNIEIPEESQSDNAVTIVYVLLDGKPAGYISLEDQIREESYDAVRTLKEKGIKVYMATGDNEEVAKSVSDELKLDGYFAGILPDEKVDVLQKIKNEGHFVAMTGDGVNDAPALAKADVGIAIGSGTDIAAETADIVLVNSNPQDIKNLILFGRATYKKMIQNLIWATGYNAIAIPLAAGVLYGAGIVLSPAAGAILMSLSTVIVAINAQLLKRKIGKE